MHIKNIVISGFRSYREQNFGHAWSPRHNVIVGRNGSGKSNFFAAIQFVLSEKFSNLRTDERKQLFHEGAGKAYTVYVEIEFDNSDGRLVLPGRPDSATVAIRRTLGLKQDEYRVNGIKFTALEVRQLLESAGFSSSNPYYIVEQGKIVSLANLRGEDRYALLKEVAGTKVYESRRAESVAILAATEEKMAKVREAIGAVEERMRLLESETKELKSFQAADLKRRVIEYAVFDSELKAAKQGLERLDGQASARLAAATEQDTDEQRLQRAVDDALAAAARENANLADLERQRGDLERELDRLQAQLTRLRLQQTEASAGSARDAAEAKALKNEEAELQKALAKARSDLKAKREAAARQKSESMKVADALRADDQRLETLQARRGRKAQFSNKGDRDRWLREEIARNERLVKENEERLAKHQAQRRALEEAVTAGEAAVKRARDAAAKADTDTNQDEGKRERLLAARDRLGASRRDKWAEAQRAENTFRRAREAADRARHAYDKAVRHDIRQGLQSLQESLDEINDPALRKAVHGRVIDLMKVDPVAVKAVDVCAGNTLFNVVVDSFDVSTRLLAHINQKKKQGRITFFPLDTCKSKPRDLPTSPAYSPLLSHVAFDKKYGSVYAELFGRTLLVKTLEAGPQAVADFDCDAITVDGDQFSRKGGITGGFLDVRSKIGATLALKEAQEAERAAKAELDAQLAAVSTIEQEIAGVLRELESTSSQTDAGRSAIDRAKQELRVEEERLVRARQAVEQNAGAMEVLERSTATVKATVAALRQEQQTEFDSKLSPAEEAELSQLQAKVVDARARADALQGAAVQAHTECQLLDDTTHHLERRLNRVQDRISALAKAAPTSKAADVDVTAAEKDIADVRKRLEAVEKAVDQSVQGRRRQEEAVAAARQALVAFQRRQADQKDNVDRAHNQRALLLQQKEQAQMKIRRLGAITTADAAPYAAHSAGKLMQLLKEVNDELKKYAHVNKKASDQYVQLTDNAKSLVEQREALAKELTSVNTMIEKLDRKKDDAIGRTFKQVQHHFDEVFHELVRAEGCSAELSLVDNDPESIAAGEDPFRAVKIQVSFGAGTANAELAQLSGGQKSLVALALIFAIQRSDPAPFYLFDEIDAALDAEYRTNVARMIQSQSDSTQFITATFKTEMLDVADQAFGIFFANRVSQIKAISQAEATALLKQAALDDRQKRDREATLEREEVNRAPSRPH